MTTDLITTQQSLEARAKSEAVPAQSFVVHGIDLMPPDDGSLARRVYDSAVDKNNPPVEAVVQYLFKNGYRRIEEISHAVKLNAPGRYSELTDMMFPPSQNERYFTSTRTMAQRTLFSELWKAAQSNVADVRKTLESYCAKYHIDKAVLDSDPALLPDLMDASVPTLVVEGLKTGKVIHPSIQSLDVFVREQEGTTDLFAFVERATPKGLSIAYGRMPDTQLPSSIASLYKSGSLNVETKTNSIPFDFNHMKCFEAQMKYDLGPIFGMFGGFIIGSGAAMAGSLLAIPILAYGVVSMIRVSPNSGHQEKKRLVMREIKQSDPFPGLTPEARKNYKSIQALERADKIAQVPLLPK